MKRGPIASDLTTAYIVGPITSEKGNLLKCFYKFHVFRFVCHSPGTKVLVLEIH